MNEQIHTNIIQQINTITKDILRFSNEVDHPIVVAIDGASGSGKSTITTLLRDKLQAAVIPLDDFFSMNIPDNQWDTFTTTEKLEKVFDWDQVKSLVLKPLRRNQQAR